MRRYRWLSFITAVGTAAAVGCGGGGSGAPPVPATAGNPPGAMMNARVSIVIPLSGPASQRHPAYVSPSTQSLSVTVASVNGATPSPQASPVVIPLTTSGTNAPCTTTSQGLSCTVTVQVPIAKAVVLLIQTYASTNGTGTPLSTGSSPAVDTTQPNAAFNLTLGGIPNTITISGAGLSSGGTISFPADNTTHTLTLQISAKDAAGNTIIAPGSFATPIMLSVVTSPAGASSHITLSQTTITSPGPSGGSTAVTVTYDGSPALTSAAVTASAGSASSVVSVNPLIVSPTGPQTLYVGQTTPLTLTVSEAGYGGAFTVTGTGSPSSPLLVVTCSPSSCSPTSPGGSVAITFVPAAATSGATLAVQDASGTAISIPYTVTSTSGGITVPTKAPAMFDMLLPGTDVNPSDIEMGPDGKTMWVALRNPNPSTPQLASFTPTQCTPTSCTINDYRLTVGLNSIVGSAALISSGNNLLAVAGSLSSGTGPATPGIALINVVTTPCSNSCQATSFVAPLISPTPVPNSLVLAPDGNLYVGESPSAGGTASIGKIQGPALTTTPQYLDLAMPSTPKNPIPSNLIVGPDGNPWFLDSANGYIGTVASGVVKEYALNLSPPPSSLSGIATGSDGFLYVTEPPANSSASGSIVRVNPTSCSAPTGNLGTCTSVTAVTLQPPSGVTIKPAPSRLTAGPDGNVWFIDPATNAVGVILLASCPTPCTALEFTVPTPNAGLSAIAAGPDGNLWFTETTPTTSGLNGPGGIGRVIP